MLALLAFVVLAPLLYIPGTLITRALRGELPPGALERTYQHVVLGALLNGWLALTLGQLGIFAAWLHLLIIAAVSAGAAALAVRRGTLRAPLRIAAMGQRRAARGAAGLALPWPTLALAGALLLFAGLVARPFETVIGVRDAGVYANAGFALARTGALVQRDALVAQIAADQSAADSELAGAAAQAETNFLGVQNPNRFIATRLRAAGFFIYEGDLAAGLVAPQGLHLFTAWIGLLTSLLGMHGGLLAPGLMGLLAVWSVGMLGRRLGGPWVGALAALLLALNAAQVWFSRYTTTETTAQFLTFAGLYFFATATAGDTASSDRAPMPAGDTRERAVAAGPSLVPALLAGLAFGQLALARIDFFLVLAPVALYLLYTWLTRRWARAHTLLAAGLSAMLVQAAVQFTTLARAYFFDTLFARLQDYALTALVTLPFLTPTLRRTFLLRPCSPLTLQPCPPIAGMPPTADAPWNTGRIALELAALALALLALLALRRWGQPAIMGAVGLLARARRPLLALAAAAVLLAGAYAYLVRPQILTGQALAALPACATPAQIRSPQGACLALQGYVGAPVPSPAYLDPLAAWAGGLPQLLRGGRPPGAAACAELRGTLLPPQADGRTVPELIRDGLLDEQAAGAQAMAELRACDPLVLRSQFANSQANLVRVGWYASPLGIVLGLVGLALLLLRLDRASWLFAAVALVAGVFFVRLTYGTSDQHYIYILRRYVPQVFPALALCAAYALLGWTNAARRQGSRSSPVRGPWRLARRGGALALAGALALFLGVTGLPIFRHTEYGGALDQLAAAAARFEEGDVLLLRGGAPTYAEARDLPDVVATPLTFAFGVDSLTIKSREPERYAAQLARYVQEWQRRGRSVYMAVGASGALPLPGLALEPAGSLALSVPEFEQLTNQKPRNVQEFQVQFALYRLIPASGAPAPAAALAPGDYAGQLSGLYRAEQGEDGQAAWTNGDALLRLALPQPAPSALTLQLAGGRRPESLGPARACVSLRNEPPPGEAAETAFGPASCFTLSETMASYVVPLPADMRGAPAVQVRIQSEPWIPARDDPQGRDPRRLGVRFGGIAAAP